MANIRGSSQTAITDCISKKRGKSQISFGQAQVNILATADNHGHIENLPNLYCKINDNFKDIFTKSDNNSTLNVLAIAGDWFIDPNQKGFKSQNNGKDLGFEDIKPDKVTAGHYQMFFLNQLMRILKLKLFKKHIPEDLPASGSPVINSEIIKNEPYISNNGEVSTSRFKTVYVPGNHCLEGGDKVLFNLLGHSSKDFTTVLTNADYKNSPALDEAKNIKEYVVLEVPDDKDKNKIHRVLVLGNTTNSVDYYCYGKMNDTSILDRTTKKTEKVDTDKDLTDTLRKNIKLIEAFKQNNPDGAVVIMNHTGNPISAKMVDALDKYNQQNNTSLKIDAILNGHDHKDQTKEVGNGKSKTKIVSLSQNNEKLASIKLHFDDNGKLTDTAESYYTEKHKEPGSNPFMRVLNDKLKMDFERNISITVTDPENPERIISDLKELGYKDIRFKNNGLANFMTDAILEVIRKYQPDTEIFGFASSAIRGNVPVNGDKANNFEMINLLCGITEDTSEVFTASVKGSDLVKMLVENVSDNMENEERNELVQWSGIQYDKDEIIKHIKDNNLAREIKSRSGRFANVEVADSIDINKAAVVVNIKSPETGEYEPVDLNKSYKLAVPELLLQTDKLITAVKLVDKFTPLSKDRKSVKTIFSEYIEDHKNNIKIKDPRADIRVKTVKNNI